MYIQVCKACSSFLLNMFSNRTITIHYVIIYLLHGIVTFFQFELITLIILFKSVVWN